MFKKIIITFILFSIVMPNSFACFKKQSGIEVIHKKTGIWTFKIDLKKYGSLIKPEVIYTTASDLYSTGKYELVVNGGFFDPKTQEPASFVVVNGETIENPFDNSSLIETLNEQKRTEAVLNRTEFRILEDMFGNLTFDIAPHFKGYSRDKRIKHSIQGGPELLPDLKWSEEGFVQFDKDERVIFESCDVTKRRPRTLLGLKSNYLYIIIFSDRNPVSLNEAREYAKKKYRLEKLMALDGGGSTALNYKDIKIFSEGVEGRKVKSFLVIERVK